MNRTHESTRPVHVGQGRRRARKKEVIGFGGQRARLHVSRMTIAIKIHVKDDLIPFVEMVIPAQILIIPD